MRNFLHKSAPFLAIVFIVCIFFYPVFVKGYVPMPADHLVGVYYPWLDYKWEGFPYGVPVKNPIAGDVPSFIYPMQTYAVELIKSGQWPLWNPLILAGTPLMANFQSAPFSPTNFVYWILPILDAWTGQMMLQPILGAIFGYLLLRYFKRSKIASVIGGIIYAFSGFMMIWMEWNGHGLVAAFFPLVALLIYKLVDTEKLIFGVILSLAIAIQLFGGYPQIIIYQFIAIALGILILDRELIWKFKKIFLVILFVSLGISLGMVQILPGYELVKLSQRGVEIVYPEWALLSPFSVIRFIAPDYFGNHSTYNYWGPADYTQSVGYSGVIAIILAVLGVITNWKEKGVKLGAIWVGMSLIIAFDTPFSRFMYQTGFLASQASSSHRIMVLSNLGIAILAAYGLDRLRFEKIQIKEIIRSLYFPGILLGVYLTVSVSIVVWINTNNNLFSEIAKLQQNMLVGIRNLVIPCILFLITIVLMFIVRRYSKYRTVIVLIFGLLAVGELFRFGWKFTPFSPKGIVFPTTPVIDFLAKQNTPFRVNANEVVPINLMMPYRIETIEGYDAVYPVKFAKYISALNSGRTDTEIMGRYGLIFNPSSNLFDLANVKYILALKKLNNGKVDPEGEISSVYESDRFETVFEDKSVAVLENKNALPRALMIYDWELEKNDNKVLEKLIDNYPIKQKALLEVDPKIPVTGTGISSVNLDEYSRSKKVKVATDKPGLLLITDSFYPGWKAFVDNKEESVLLANYNFMAIPIYTSGEHIVELKYYPDSFMYGLYITLASALALLAILIYSNIIKRRHGA